MIFFSFILLIIVNNVELVHTLLFPSQSNTSFDETELKENVESQFIEIQKFTSFYKGMNCEITCMLVSIVGGEYRRDTQSLLLWSNITV